MRKYLINYFKKIIYLVVFYGFSVASAGSYDDFFTAVQRDDAATVRNLLARGFDANTVDPKGLHGLYLALREPSVPTQRESGLGAVVSVALASTPVLQCPVAPTTSREPAPSSPSLTTLAA